MMLAATWLVRRRGKAVRPVLRADRRRRLRRLARLRDPLTDQTPAAAYFSTFARAWELALGAGLALLGDGQAAAPRRGR